MTRPKRKRGRPPALTDAEADGALFLYYRTSCSAERVARHYRVSAPTIHKLIDKRGAEWLARNPCP